MTSSCFHKTPQATIHYLVLQNHSYGWNLLILSLDWSNFDKITTPLVYFWDEVLVIMRDNALHRTVVIKCLVSFPIVNWISITKQKHGQCKRKRGLADIHDSPGGYFVMANQWHYSDIIMSAIAPQITGLSNVCATVCSGADQRQHQCSGSLALVRGIRLSLVNVPYKAPETWNMFPFYGVIMIMWYGERRYSDVIRAFSTSSINEISELFAATLFGRLTQMKQQSSALLVHCEWSPSATGVFPSQRTND